MLSFSKPRHAQLDGYTLECPKGDWKGQELTIGRLQNIARLHSTTKHQESPTFAEVGITAAKPKAKQLGFRRPYKLHRKPTERGKDQSTRAKRRFKHKRASDQPSTPHPQAPKIEPLAA